VNIDMDYFLIACYMLIKLYSVSQHMWSCRKVWNLQRNILS